MSWQTKLFWKKKFQVFELENCWDFKEKKNFFKKNFWIKKSSRLVHLIFDADFKTTIRIFIWLWKTWKKSIFWPKKAEIGCFWVEKSSKRVEIVNLQVSTWNFFEPYFYTQGNQIRTQSRFSDDIATLWKSLLLMP